MIPALQNVPTHLLEFEMFHRRLYTFLEKLPFVASAKDVEAVKGMNRHQRRRWAKRTRLARRAAP